MNILQICSEYRDSKVHKELFKALDKKGVKQTIFCFFRESKFIGANQFDGNNCKFIYAAILSKLDHYLFYLKERKILRYLLTHTDVTKFNYSQAATLFSNGYISYKLKKKYKIPYIVAVRSTDLAFYKYAPHVSLISLRILRNANQIVFISKALYNRFISIPIIASHLKEFSHKMVIQPNGINEFWHHNLNKTSISLKSHSVIYVGTFLRRKNVIELADAIYDLRKEKGFSDTILTIVGGSKDNNNYTHEYLEKYSFVKIYDNIRDKEKLKEIYRSNSVFAMTSIHETFGLVYIEALSQNLPVIYSLGDGIDGMLDRSAGIAVNPNDVNSIKEGIKEILSNRSIYNNNSVDFSTYYWPAIAERYISWYHSCL